MKVIFTDKVKGVASKGDVKNVRPGFYRNFLQPYKKAVVATDSLLKDWEEKRKQLVIEKQELKSKLDETKARLAGAKLQIEKKVTAKGTLYGGVKAADVVKAIKDHLKIEIPEEAVMLDSAIKSIGSYEVKLNFGEGVEASVPVEIVQKD